MRRITIWLTVTLAVVAMAFYYQAGLSGDGKEGDHGGQPATRVGAGTARPSGPNSTPTTQRAGSDSDHTGKPGESK